MYQERRYPEKDVERIVEVIRAARADVLKRLQVTLPHLAGFAFPLFEKKLQQFSADEFDPLLAIICQRWREKNNPHINLGTHLAAIHQAPPIDHKNFIWALHRFLNTDQLLTGVLKAAHAVDVNPNARRHMEKVTVNSLEIFSAFHDGHEKADFENATGRFFCKVLDSAGPQADRRALANAVMRRSGLARDNALQLVDLYNLPALSGSFESEEDKRLAACFFGALALEAAQNRVDFTSSKWLADICHWIYNEDKIPQGFAHLTTPGMLAGRIRDLFGTRGADADKDKPHASLALETLRLVMVERAGQAKDAAARSARKIAPLQPAKAMHIVPRISTDDLAQVMNEETFGTGDLSRSSLLQEPGRIRHKRGKKRTPKPASRTPGG